MNDRRVYAIPVDDDLAEHLADAEAADCGEIVQGVPAAFDDGTDIELPHVFVEEVPDTCGPTLADVASTIEASPDLTEDVRAALLAVLQAISP